VDISGDVKTVMAILKKLPINQERPRIQVKIAGNEMEQNGN